MIERPWKLRKSKFFTIDIFGIDLLYTVQYILQVDSNNMSKAFFLVLKLDLAERGPHHNYSIATIWNCYVALPLNTVSNLYFSEPESRDSTRYLKNVLLLYDCWELIVKTVSYIIL